MRRREIIAAVLTAAAWQRQGLAQHSRPARIGVLLQVPASEPTVAPLWKALLDGLREHGWEDGRNLILEGRFGGRDAAGFRELAADLVRLNVRALLAANPFSIARGTAGDLRHPSRDARRRRSRALGLGEVAFSS